MIEAYLATWLACLVAIASPGPNLMAVASVSLAQGRRHGLMVVAGIVSGVAIWATGTAFGLTALFTTFPLSLLALKLLGGSYLLYIGLKALWGALKNAPVTIQAARDERRVADCWRLGFLVVLTNPKAALMWGAVGTYLFGEGLTPLEVLGFAPLGALSAAAIYGGYALLFSSGVVTRRYPRYARAIEAVFGAAFTVLGGKLLLDGLREMRRISA